MHEQQVVQIHRIRLLKPLLGMRSLCVRGSNDIAVATSNLVAGGFMTTSLMGTRYCPCLVSERPELVPVGM
jgi:hypothetical protein